MLQVKLTILATAFLLLGTADKAPIDFPVPSGKDKMLFYVQRSLNKNTIIYELNESPDRKLDMKKPVKMYWVNYAGKGDESNLNYLQSHYAYGLEFSVIDATKPSFSLSFVSYRKQLLYLTKGENG